MRAAANFAMTDVLAGSVIGHIGLRVRLGRPVNSRSRTVFFMVFRTPDDQPRLPVRESTASNVRTKRS